MSTSVIVCLGQALGPGGEPHPLLLSRCRLAAKLHKERGLDIINTGGNGGRGSTTEAGVMTRYMVEEGRVRMEERANTTLENAMFVREMLEGGGGTVVLVTSQFHMPRSGYVLRAIFDRVGVEVEEQPAEDMVEGMEELVKSERRLVEWHIGNNAVTRNRKYRITPPDRKVME